MDMFMLAVSGPQIPCQMWFGTLVPLPNTEGPGMGKPQSLHLRAPE